MYQTGQSFDLTMALAIHLLDLTHKTTDNSTVPTFIHFKPKAQDWDKPSETVTSRVPLYNFGDKLMLDTYMLNDILHYVEDDYITPEIKELFV